MKERMKKWLNERNIHHGSCVYSAKKERKKEKKFILQVSSHARKKERVDR